MSKTGLNKVSFFSKPIVGIVGSIFSIIALPLSVYFYIESLQSPNLTFSRNPSQFEVITTSKSSKFTVKYDQQSVNGDVSIAQIAIWNQGNKPIRTEDILTPIIIYSDADVSILEANVRKVSRDEIRFQIENNQIQEKKILINWKILEQGDGGVVEIIYVGSTDTRFDISGSIVGQKNNEIVRYQNIFGFKSPNEEFNYRRKLNIRRQLFFLVFGILVFVGFIFVLFKLVFVKEDDKSVPLIDSRVFWGGFSVLLLLMLVLSIWALLLSKYPFPPPDL